MSQKDKLQLLKQRHQTWLSGRQSNESISTKQSITSPLIQSNSSSRLSYPVTAVSELDVSIDNWVKTRPSGTSHILGTTDVSLSRSSETTLASNRPSYTTTSVTQDEDDPSEMMNKYKQQYQQYCKRCELLQDEATGLEKERAQVEQELQETTETLEKSQVDYKQYKILVESYQKKLEELGKTISESQKNTATLSGRLTAVKTQEEAVRTTLTKLEKQKNNAKIIWTGIQSSLSSE